MNPGAATVAVPKPSEAKAKRLATPTTPPRPPPPTHTDLFALFPPLSINEYSKGVMDVVKCESQVQDLLLNKLLGEDFLTQEER
ncbi:hypothetical protein SETIT_5G139600v2 [Setaria italica]|uniref:Uncharacterized protein n=1 Tax=Setaria italica TaxID=4555 RepID=A0A368R4U4_SETIT|nr:hypothetical protein SETIT_5G139600v2 [Setaria italica]